MSEYTEEIEEVDPASLRPSVTNFAALDQRKGVFVHSFKCLDCSLEFSVFSWWPDRQTVVNTACPECCRVTQKTHWRADISTTPGAAFGEGPEIYDYTPVGKDARLQTDSSIFTGSPKRGDSLEKCSRSRT